jgi:uncharacterized membrane protein YhaH (DUF805 family)
MNWKHVFFSAKGRLGRRDYWIAVLLLAILSAVTALLGPVGALLGLVLIYPQICIFAKRLHDIGRSGWLAALPFGLALLGGVAGEMAQGDEPAAVIPAAIGTVLLIAAIVISFRVGLSKGEPEPNAYGPPPGVTLEPTEGLTGGAG